MAIKPYNRKQIPYVFVPKDNFDHLPELDLYTFEHLLNHMVHRVPEEIPRMFDNPQSQEIVETFYKFIDSLNQQSPE